MKLPTRGSISVQHTRSTPAEHWRSDHGIGRPGTEAIALRGRVTKSQTDCLLQRQRLLRLNCGRKGTLAQCGAQRLNGLVVIVLLTRRSWFAMRQALGIGGPLEQSTTLPINTRRMNANVRAC